MNRIDQTFQRLKTEGKIALIPFISAGDPDLDTCLEIIGQLALAGADMIELGVPYSDPLADGPVIQRASERALKHHVTIVDCIRLAKKARDAQVDIPFILFTYYNPVLQLGLERLFGLLRENEISGIIIPDLPIEEDAQVRKLALQYQIHLIPLIAPTSNERIQKIAEHAAGGFVYCVSSLGVTGVRSQFYEGIEPFVAAVKQATDLPVAVGFGISNKEQVTQISKMADGAIIGSAIVRQIEQAVPLLADPQTRPAGLLQIREFVRQLMP